MNALQHDAAAMNTAEIKEGRDVTDLPTLREAAAELRVSTRTLEREARDGRIAITRIRSIRLVARAELNRYITAMRAEPRQAEKPVTTTASVYEELMAVASREYRRLEQRTNRRERSKLWAASRKAKIQ